MRKLIFALLILTLLFNLCACQTAVHSPTEPPITTPAVTEPVTTEPPPTETEPPITGWIESEGKRYYLDTSGTPQTGWLELEDGLYFMDETGVMVTGWLEWDERRFYLREDGRAAQGKLIIEDVTYYFPSRGEHVLLVNRWNPIAQDFTVELETAQGFCMDTQCMPAVQQMLDDLEAAVGKIGLLNGYRSYTIQYDMFYGAIQSLQNAGYSYASAYAQVFTSVAIPGTSEHQLGLAIDILDPVDTFYSNGETETIAWLKEHCWDYGFIVRYPDGKSDITGIIYEPWHYRYVGIELAQELRDSGLCLEEYMDQLTNDGTTCGNPDALNLQ